MRSNPPLTRLASRATPVTPLFYPYMHMTKTSIEGLANDWQRSFEAGALGIHVRPTDATDNDTSVADTLGLMAGYVNQAMGSKQIANALNQAGIDDASSESETIERVFRFIKSRVKFVEDEVQLAGMFNIPEGKELLIRPEVLLTMAKPMGDCDDFTMLACSMLNASGVKGDFVTVAADSRYPDIFSHVYCMVTKSNGEQVPFDASHGSRVGWETDKQFRKKVWPFLNVRELGDNMSVSLKGLGNPIDWGAIVPDLFKAGGQIGIQLTQRPGYQTKGPDGSTTSYILPSGAVNSGVLNFPGTSVGGFSSSTMLLGGLAIVALLFFKGKS